MPHIYKKTCHPVFIDFKNGKIFKFFNIFSKAAFLIQKGGKIVKSAILLRLDFIPNISAHAYAA
jgi:hypothetical protein